MEKNQIIHECENIIAQNKANAEQRADAYLAIAKSDADFVCLDKQERALSFEVGKLRANGKDSKAQTQILKDVRNKKAEVLKKLGIKEEQLSAAYSCPLCRDTGTVAGGMCFCLKKMVDERILKECGIDKKRLATFKDFKDNIAEKSQQETQNKLCAKFKKIAEEFPEKSPRIILLSGQTGVGKTFLAECLTSLMLEKGFTASVLSAFNLNNLMLSYHTCYDDRKQSFLSAALDPDSLLIDDLGTEPIFKNVTLEYLYLIISERSRLGKLTIITTNLDLSDILSRYGERIFSRLTNQRESLKAYLKGRDLRLK